MHNTNVTLKNSSKNVKFSNKCYWLDLHGRGNSSDYCTDESAKALQGEQGRPTLGSWQSHQCI